MSNVSTRLCRITLRAAIVVGSLALGLARAEDAVLLSSTVPGYASGMVVSSADRLSVPDGASVTLLFQSGEMLRLRGPFEGTLANRQAGADKGGAAAFAEVFRSQGVDATVIGGTRSTALTRSTPVLEDVVIDPQRSGTYCVEPATSVWIQRPATGSEGYALRRKGNSRVLKWPLNAGRMEWPSDVPVDDGSQFEITTGGAAKATVTFRALPVTAGAGPAQVAAGLILGCREQFETELKRLGRSVAAPEVWITTDRGRHPIYRTGDAVGLTIVANADGYLYCFAAGEGGVRAVFPAGAVDGAQLRDSTPLTIPGRRQPLGLMASAGGAQVRCWLADRDITPELPHALLGPSSLRLPDQLAGDLDALFARVNGTRLVADALTVRTE
jgi:hypothetical protein